MAEGKKKERERVPERYSKSDEKTSIGLRSPVKKTQAK